MKIILTNVLLINGKCSTVTMINPLHVYSAIYIAG